MLFKAHGILHFILLICFVICELATNHISPQSKNHTYDMMDEPKFTYYKTEMFELMHIDCNLHTLIFFYPKCPTRVCH